MYIFKGIYIYVDKSIYKHTYIIICIDKKYSMVYKYIL